MVGGLKLKCDFKTYETHWGVHYSCIINDSEILMSRNRYVTQIIGIHIENKNNSDVQKVYSKHQSWKYLPKNLGSFFENLKVLQVISSNERLNLLKGDLQGLDKLKILDVQRNKIESIPKNYFEGHSSIEIISFRFCYLSFVHKTALGALVNLRAADFSSNACADFNFDDLNSIEDLKRNLIECDGTRKIFREPCSFDDSGSESDEFDYDYKAAGNKTTTTTEKPVKLAIIRKKKSFIQNHARWIISLCVLIIIISVSINVFCYLKSCNLTDHVIRVKV